MSTPMSIDAYELEQAQKEALRMAREAGAVLRSGYRTGVEARTKKAKNDLVTEYDLRSEQVIRARVAQVFQGHVVVGEEGHDDDASKSRFVWWVDPLDGTTNFVHGHPHFAVSIALAVDGEPVVAAVVAPALGAEWTAAKGLGASRDGRPCRVSDTSQVDEALFATGFTTPCTPEDNFREFTHFTVRSRGVRRCGSAALDLVGVADGTYDAYWDLRLKPWDLAAGSLIVREAGGRCVSLDGVEFELTSPSIVASNGAIHAPLMDGLVALAGRAR